MSPDPADETSERSANVELVDRNGRCAKAMRPDGQPDSAKYQMYIGPFRVGSELSSRAPD
jgi:hypothetical protein